MENFRRLALILKDKQVNTIYVKPLRPNDNSKNQIYFAGNIDTLNILPLGPLKVDDSNRAGATTARYKAGLEFYWIDNSGNAFLAPETKLIYYPDYPEVRLSGFLRGCKNFPSNIAKREEEPGRLLFLGVSDDKKIYGYVSGADSALTRSFNAFKQKDSVGVFLKVITDSVVSSVARTSKDVLLQKLKEIHVKGWINSKRLDGAGSILSCNSPQCGGYTLEAEFDIRPNGKAEPDFLGWELKQFAVKKFNLIGSSRVTLMTPEPSGGFYRDHGATEFVNKYGYSDKKGRENRRNFGGIYKVNHITAVTGLKTVLTGYDAATKKITDPAGELQFVDTTGAVAASWSFEKLLDHWVRKHASACYVPSIKASGEPRRYSYGNIILLYQDTDFIMFLDQLQKQNIFLDPALKVFSAASDGKSKMRNQFRILSKNLGYLYRTKEIVDLRALNG